TTAGDALGTRAVSRGSVGELAARETFDGDTGVGITAETVVIAEGRGREVTADVAAAGTAETVGPPTNGRCGGGGGGGGGALVVVATRWGVSGSGVSTGVRGEADAVGAIAGCGRTCAAVGAGSAG